MPRVAFLWHLHQPDYRHPDSGIPTMPWTRLHALRGYRDMVLESVEEGHAWTLNLVPSLLDQWMHYARGGSDPHLDLTRVPADALTDSQRREVQHRFVCGHPAMQRAWRGYEALAGRVHDRVLAEQDLRDLQVWSTLGWFGHTAHRDFPALGELARKGAGFTEDDKATMLQVQGQLLAEIPGWLRRLGGASQTAVSASPYDHPILPLLIDARAAHRALPHLPDDVDFAWPADALGQLVDARVRVGELTGRAPVGLWPSEGSVSPEVVPLAAEAGFRWLCSDRGVLERSGRTGGGAGGWRLGHGVRGFFRDTHFSDAIGFRAAGRDPAKAAQELAGALAQRDGVVVVALDGENPWESFSDAGGAYRTALIHALERAGVALTTLDEELEREPVGAVHALHSGSWIGADFRIWAGHEEDRDAWRALADVRRAADTATPEAFAAARPHLFAAEGSDWFWWYGDDFDTPFADRFDALFRAHVAAAWRALGLPVPESLDEPIKRRAGPTVHPQAAWGEVDGAWRSRHGAGSVEVPQGAMARGRRAALFYAWSRTAEALGPLHLWLDGDGLWLEVDGVRHEAGRPISLQEASVEVRVVGPDGPAWPGVVRLTAPALDDLWHA